MNPDMLTNLMAVATFVAIFIAAFIFLQFLIGRRSDPIRDRLERAVADAEGDGTDRPRADDEALFGSLTAGLAAQIPQTAFEEAGLDQDLRRAGYYRPNSRRDYLAMRNLLLIVCVVATGIAAVISGPDNWDLTIIILIVGAIVSVLAFGLPRFYIYFKANNRVRRIVNGLPDALDMISMCVSGGLALQPALDRVSRELYVSHPDLALELAIVRYQAEVGSLGRAFRQLAFRIDVPEVKSISSLVTQAEKLGSNVVEALRDYADTMRQNRRQRGEEQANRTGIKLLFPLVLLMAPSVFILLWGPALLELRSFFLAETGPGGAFDQMSVDEIRNTTQAAGFLDRTPGVAPATQPLRTVQ